MGGWLITLVMVKSIERDAKGLFYVLDSGGPNKFHIHCTFYKRWGIPSIIITDVCGLGNVSSLSVVVDGGGIISNGGGSEIRVVIMLRLPVAFVYEVTQKPPLFVCSSSHELTDFYHLSPSSTHHDILPGQLMLFVSAPTIQKR